MQGRPSSRNPARGGPPAWLGNKGCLLRLPSRISRIRSGCHQQGALVRARNRPARRRGRGWYRGLGGAVACRSGAIAAAGPPEGPLGSSRRLRRAAFARLASPARPQARRLVQPERRASRPPGTSGRLGANAGRAAALRAVAGPIVELRVVPRRPAPAGAAPASDAGGRSSGRRCRRRPRPGSPRRPRRSCGHGRAPPPKA
jgi:hypothetical protein